jgi:copper homeostasis protein
MSNGVVLEICVESVEHAVAAERGGAHRIELCADLKYGGVTPSAETMQAARRLVRVPIHVMVRPRSGDFRYSGQELETMRQDVLAAKRLGMDGIVLGILDGSGHVDIAGTQALVELAHPLPVTFHRAFDASDNLERALEDVIATGASRILTSGGRRRAVDALPLLGRLVQAARERIRLMLCGGINADNITHALRTTRAQEIHSSVGTSSGKSNSGNTLEADAERDDDSWPDGTEGSNLDSAHFERRVAKLVSLLQGYSAADCDETAS